MMKIISIVNQKGGVGKTTTAVNLSCAFTSIDMKVLLIDFDPQGNATTGLGVKKSQLSSTVYDVLRGSANLEKSILKSNIPNLYLLPTDAHLAHGERMLIKQEDGAYKLKSILSTLVGYDLVIIDCPPSLGALSINALVASDSVLIPVQCEFYALEGLGGLLDTIERIRHNLNSNLAIEGIVLTMFDPRNKLSHAVMMEVREFMGDLVYRNYIPRNIRLSEAPSHGLPAIIYDLRCPGSYAYVNLAKEVVSRLKKVAA